jgi:hypothetical protein
LRVYNMRRGSGGLAAKPRQRGAACCTSTVVLIINDLQLFCATLNGSVSVTAMAAAGVLYIPTCYKHHTHPTRAPSPNLTTHSHVHTDNSTPPPHSSVQQDSTQAQEAFQKTSSMSHQQLSGLHTNPGNSRVPHNSRDHSRCYCCRFALLSVGCCVTTPSHSFVCSLVCHHTPPPHLCLTRPAPHLCVTTPHCVSHTPHLCVTTPHCVSHTPHLCVTTPSNTLK